MPVLRGKDGKLIVIDDNASPAVVARIARENGIAPSKATNVSRGAKPTSPVDPRVARKRREMGIAAEITPLPVKGELGNRVLNAATFGLADRGKAAIAAGVDSMIGRGNFKDNYASSREALRQNSAEYADENPYTSLAGDIAGALLSPVGAGTGVAKVLSKVAPNAKKAIDANRIAQQVARAGNSSIGLGVRAGANYGAIDSAINGEGELPERVIRGAAQGGAMGSVGGAFGGVLNKGREIISNRLPENASRVAYGKVKNALSRQRNIQTGQPFDAKAARNEILATDKAGGDAMVMDLSPELRNMAGYIAPKPGLQAGTEIETRVQSRMDQNKDRFNTNVRQLMKDRLPEYADEFDAYAHVKTTKAARKGEGGVDYAPGGTMDKPLKGNATTRDFFKSEPPEFKKALKSAFTQMLNRGEIPTNFQGAKSFQSLPNLRALDYVKRHYDGKIGEALRAGNTSKAQELSWQLSRVKEVVGKSNPEYQNILARQRDLFQEQQSAEFGQKFLTQVFQNPRKLLDDINAEKMKPEAVLLGMTDALLQMDARRNPVQVARAILKGAESRKVMLHLLGSNRKLAQFERFVEREIRTARTDKIVDPTTGSKTNALREQADPDEVGAIEGLFKGGLQGAAYGGATGLVSNVLRKADTLSSGLGPHAQEELGRILMSKGDTLEEGIKGAQKYSERMERARVKRAQRAGKVAAEITGVQ